MRETAIFQGNNIPISWYQYQSCIPVVTPTQIVYESFLLIIADRIVFLVIINGIPFKAINDRITFRAIIDGIDFRAIIDGIMFREITFRAIID